MNQYEIKAYFQREINQMRVYQLINQRFRIQESIHKLFLVSNRFNFLHNIYQKFYVITL